MTLNGVMALILRYFAEFVYDVVIKCALILFKIPALTYLLKVHVRS